MNGSLYIFGGEDSSRRPVSELHVLDLASMTWREVQTTGRAPAARSAHAAVPYKARNACRCRRDNHQPIATAHVCNKVLDSFLKEVALHAASHMLCDIPSELSWEVLAAE